MASASEVPIDTEACFHEEHEWDAQRDNFVRYYKDDNKTLKAATQCMIANHHFYATPRQWERKISAWGITKYTPRSERMQQIESQGRTLVEVAAGGRRPRKYSNTLEVDDNRNIRRFARRALSRSPSSSRARSRSSSAGQQSPCPSPHPEMIADDVIVRERGYDLDVSVFVQDANPSSVPAILTNQHTDNPQAHVMELQNPMTGETHTELYFDFPAPHETQNPTPVSPMMHHRMAYEPFPTYASGIGSSPIIDTNGNTTTIHASLGEKAMFIPQSSDAMDLSPANAQDVAVNWQNSEALGLTDVNAPFGSSMSSMHQSFEQSLLTPVQSIEFSPDMNDPTTVMGSVPMLLLPPEAPSPHPHNASPAVGTPVTFTPVPGRTDLELRDPYPDFSRHVDEYAEAIGRTFLSLLASPQSPEAAARELEHYKVTFSRQMNATLDSLVMSAQRSVRSGLDANRFLRQRIASLENKNAQMNPVTPHRFSLGGPVSSFSFPQFNSRPVTPLDSGM